VIGGGWALHYLRTGFDVDVYDPAPAARAGLLRMVEASWPLLERMGLREGASPGRLTFHDSLAAAVAGADLVLENAPENGPVKRRVLAEVDRAARPEVVIASSTSGFAMTMLQADCQHPERCVAGHPFNPPYLIPVVEVVGGSRTDPAAVDWLVRFYASTGKRPLRLSREQPGFVGNRLQEALWREALHMVAAGEATVEEIDASIAFGPGLRWALMGPCLTFHLAGGGGGMAHMLDHVGLGAAYQARTGSGIYTAERHLCFVSGVTDGAALEYRTQLLGHDSKRMHVFHQMTSGQGLSATCELMFLHVTDGRVEPMPPEPAAAVAALAARHACLPPPGRAGRRIAMPVKPAR
jgi:carnitine 3-dehydrogenase